MSARTALKGVIERGVVLTGAPRLSRRARRGDTFILAYHNIVPSGERPVGDRSLHLPQAAFAQQLDLLRATHEVVPLAELLEAGTAGGGRPRAAITFDDAYHGAMTVGVEELRRRNVPATVFVTPDYVGGKAFWWDLLTPTGAEALPADVRDTALTIHRGRQVEICATTAAGTPPPPIPIWARCANAVTIDAALAFGELTLASHTWSHPNLTRLADDELTHELAAPLEWLTMRYGVRALPMISYPYGLADARVWDAARDAGYSAGFMIDGGWVRGNDATVNPHAIPRLNIPAGVSEAGFTLRVSGFLTT